MAMTRLHYWLHAQTQYNIHSPFLFDMYREVLFARLTPEERRRHGIPRGDRYRELLYKCCNHYHLQPATPSPQQPTAPDRASHSSPKLGEVPQRGGGVCQTLLTPTHFSIFNSQFSILLVSRPHATPAAERQWETLKADPTYQVSLDLYDVALLIRNPHLTPQHLLLR